MARDELLVIEFFDGKRWVFQLARPDSSSRNPVFVSTDSVLNVYGSHSMAILGQPLPEPTWHYFPLVNVRTWERKPV